MCRRRIGRLLTGATATAFGAIALAGVGPFAGTLAEAGAEEPQPQTAPLVWDDVPVNLDSGFVTHDGVGAGVQAVYSELIDARDAAWIRLEFGDVRLSGSRLLGNNAYLRITSLEDGAHQILDSVSIQQWQHTSAYFNGSAVEVELFAHPGSPASRVQIVGYQHGLVDDDAGLSLCDGTDTRQLTAAAPDARLRPVGCTGWLISDQCFVTAGHCSGGSLQVAEFNVPMSNSDGSLVFSHPNDQYAVDPASRQQGNAGCGDDWAYFGTFTNSNTGLTPFQAQGAMYTMAGAVPAPNNQNIRVRGYGVTVGFPPPNSWNQVLKISFGPYVMQTGTLLQYRVDASPGDSGSALYNTQTGTVIGIVTCTGCSNNWPDFIGNRGTAITHPGLQNALANPQGVCVSTGPSCPPSDESCYETGGPGCEDTECCELVCGQDPFCCETSWDGLCVEQAIDLCHGCGHPDAGDCCEANGSSHCNNFECCDAVCAFDPFCCDTSWDSLCADGAETVPACGCGPSSNCPADLNGDGNVDGLDLLIMLGAWGPNPGHIADLNNDGNVDGLDLLILLSSWGPCPVEGECDTPFVCGQPVPWCDDEQTCACLAQFNGETICATDWSCTGITCPTGSCPAGHVCIVDSCCGETTCMPVEGICGDEPPVCDEGFVCGGDIPWCNEDEFCVCFHTFSGGIECLNAEVSCTQECPTGSCPPGEICITDTCCNGGAPTCIPEIPCEPPPPICEDGFLCGQPIPWCNEPDQCLCMTTFSGSIECIQNTSCGQTCPAGTCPSGQICVVDTCCNGGVPTCITPTFCQPSGEVCDDLFECGVPFPDGYCEQGCLCVETVEGQSECLNGNAPCGPACTPGSCPSGQVCIANTCCGPSNCVDIAWLDCGSPAAGGVHDGPTVSGMPATTPGPAATRPTSQTPQPAPPGNTLIGDQQPAISPREMNARAADLEAAQRRDSGLGSPK